jgi:WD40 repeat protein
MEHRIADGGMTPAPLAEPPAIPRARRHKKITVALIAVVAIGLLATGITIFLRPSERPGEQHIVTGHYHMLAVATAQLDGRTVIISGGEDTGGLRATVRVWDLNSGAPIGQPLTGHVDGVEAVTTAQLDGRPVIISGGYDGTIRIWDLAGVES